MIVVVEGGDAAGKQTQSTKLAERLKGTRFAFPNYLSETGQAILSHLKNPLYAVGHFADDKLDAMVFQCLQTANRLELLPEIEAALDEGPVVFDRYWQSAYVYGALDGLNRDWLRRVQEAPMPPADVNILIDVPVAAGFERRPERRDRYESNRAFMEKVRVEYMRLWGFDHIRWGDDAYIRGERAGWYVVNGLGTIDEVHARIWSIFRHLKLEHDDRNH